MCMAGYGAGMEKTHYSTHNRVTGVTVYHKTWQNADDAWHALPAHEALVTTTRDTTPCPVNGCACAEPRTTVHPGRGDPYAETDRITKPRTVDRHAALKRIEVLAFARDTRRMAADEAREYEALAVSWAGDMATQLLDMSRGKR